MNRQLESMTRLRFGEFTIRVWRAETERGPHDNRDLQDLAHKIWVNMRHKPIHMELAEAFEKMPRVAAVEVLTQDGSGVLIYPDWK